MDEQPQNATAIAAQVATPDADLRPPAPKRLPITLIVLLGKEPIAGAVGGMTCHYCNEPFTMSESWPFTNACQSCGIEQSVDLVELVDKFIAESNPKWIPYQQRLRTEADHYEQEQGAFKLLTLATRSSQLVAHVDPFFDVEVEAEHE